MSGMNYSDNEPRVHESGEWVDVVQRGEDMQGVYVEIRFKDRRVKRVHPSRVRPLTFLEYLDHWAATTQHGRRTR